MAGSATSSTSSTSSTSAAAAAARPPPTSSRRGCPDVKPTLLFLALSLTLALASKLPPDSSGGPEEPPHRILEVLVLDGDGGGGPDLMSQVVELAATVSRQAGNCPPSDLTSRSREAIPADKVSIVGPLTVQVWLPSRVPSGVRLYLCLRAVTEDPGRETIFTHEFHLPETGAAETEDAAKAEDAASGPDFISGSADEDGDTKAEEEAPPPSSSKPLPDGSDDSKKYALVRNARDAAVAAGPGGGGVEDEAPRNLRAQIVSFHIKEIINNYLFYDEGSPLIFLQDGSGANDLIVSGFGLTNGSAVRFTSMEADYGASCQFSGGHLDSTILTLTATPGGGGGGAGEDDGDSGGGPAGTYGNTAYLDIPAGDLTTLHGQDTKYYICLWTPQQQLQAGVVGVGGGQFVHQGRSLTLTINVFSPSLPTWVKVCFIGMLLCMSGLFSGLNLGLMALDRTELKIVLNTGSERERRYAKQILPVRKHGNYLLCTLLLGNVLVNNTLTILLDSLTSGLVAVLGSTFGIVIFGEIVPQAACSRYALAVGANTIWLTKVFMLLTFPLSFPISLILDRVLGDEIGTVYDKRKLIELLRVTKENNDLEKDEVDIVTGALVFKEKTVRHVMTPIEDCYMLPLHSVLNFETISEIREQGYSRIPVYVGRSENDDDDDGEKAIETGATTRLHGVGRCNIVHILFAKDLMFIDPDDNMPLAMVCEFYNNDVNFVFHDTPLNVMFNEFKSGEKGHMAFVQDVNTSGDGDPFYETIGLVTLEDIIEEIIQQEIVDETDVIIDNRTKKRRKRVGKGYEGKEGNFPVMAGDTPNRRVKVSPQLTLAVFQYLSTSIEPFKGAVLAELVLKKLLTLDIFREVKLKRTDASKTPEKDLVIIRKGQPVAFFVLIVEGRVEVNIGREELIFESGPFSYFAIQVLTQILASFGGGGGNQQPSESAGVSPSSPNPSASRVGSVTFAQQQQPLSVGNATNNNSNNNMLSNSFSASAAGSGGIASTTSALPTSSGGGGQQQGGVHPFRKASTLCALDTSSVVAGGGGGGNKRSSMDMGGGPTMGTPNLSHANRNNSLVPGFGASSTTAGTAGAAAFAPFVPDYTVKAVTDVLYLKVSRTTYMRALRASQMSLRSQAAGEMTDRELDNILDRVNEDDQDAVEGAPAAAVAGVGEAGIRSPRLDRATSVNFTHNQLLQHQLGRRESALRLSGNSLKGAAAAAAGRSASPIFLSRTNFALSKQNSDVSLNRRGSGGSVAELTSRAALLSRQPQQPPPAAVTALAKADGGAKVALVEEAGDDDDEDEEEDTSSEVASDSGGRTGVAVVNNGGDKDDDDDVRGGQDSGCGHSVVVMNDHVVVEAVQDNSNHRQQQQEQQEPPDKV